jgi:hypothetical protein
MASHLLRQVCIHVPLPISRSSQQLTVLQISIFLYLLFNRLSKTNTHVLSWVLETQARVEVQLLPSRPWRLRSKWQSPTLPRTILPRISQKNLAFLQVVLLRLYTTFDWSPHWCIFVKIWIRCCLDRLHDGMVIWNCITLCGRHDLMNFWHQVQ